MKQQTKLESLEKALDQISTEETAKSTDISNNSYSRAEDTRLMNTAEEAVKHQDYEIRQKYIKAVDKDIKSRKKVRSTFLTFYMWFISVVTGLIFLVIIDPIQLCRGQDSMYSNSLKLSLVGVFFANLISIALVMVKYSFAPIDNVMEAFEKLSEHNNRNK